LFTAHASLEAKNAFNVSSLRRPDADWQAKLQHDCGVDPYVGRDMSNTLASFLRAILRSCHFRLELGEHLVSGLRPHM